DDHNDDHRRARGVIIDAALHEDTAPDGTPDTWVEVLMEIDAINFPKLAAAILAGDIERTSMGCDVRYSVCSVCGNKASTPSEYCKHIPRLKGKRIRRRTASGSGTEDVLVHEVCHGLSFFENSVLVEPPADPTAHFLGVDDSGVRSLGMGKTAAFKPPRKSVSPEVTEALREATEVIEARGHNLGQWSGMSSGGAASFDVRCQSCGRGFGVRDWDENRIRKQYPGLENIYKSYEVTPGFRLSFRNGVVEDEWTAGAMCDPFASAPSFTRGLKVDDPKIIEVVTTALSNGNFNVGKQIIDYLMKWDGVGRSWTVNDKISRGYAKGGVVPIQLVTNDYEFDPSDWKGSWLPVHITAKVVRSDQPKNYRPSDMMANGPLEDYAHEQEVYLGKKEVIRIQRVEVWWDGRWIDVLNGEIRAKASVDESPSISQERLMVTASRKKAAMQINDSESRNYNTGFITLRAEVDIPEANEINDLPVNVMVEANEYRTKSWMVRVVYGPHYTKDARGSYYSAQIIGDFIGSKSEAKAHIRRELKRAMAEWKQGGMQRQAAGSKTAASKSYVIVSGLATSEKNWEVHSAGCKDLSNPKYRVSTQLDTVQAESAEEAIAELLSYLADQGWTEDDFRVLPCAGGKSKSNSNAGKVQCPAGLEKVKFDRSNFTPNCYRCGTHVKQTRNGTYVKHWAGPKLNEPDCPRTGQTVEASEVHCSECDTRVNVRRGDTMPPHKMSMT
ncbi:MAG: hypothetical protein ACO3SP_11500, partial [Ilumatobacteraceae bacterium]